LARQNSTFDRKKHNFEGLEQTRQILRKVNKGADDWLVNTYKRNKLLIKHGWPQDKIAEYDILSKKLFLYSAFFDNNDGLKASYIMHEYVHSKQSIILLLRSRLSFNNTVMEKDAYNTQAHVLVCLSQPKIAHEIFLE